MKFYFILLIFLFFSIDALCQHHPCGTTSQDQLRTVEFVKNLQSQQNLSRSETTDEVPIQVHIIGADNGLFAIDSQRVIDEIEILNDYFAAIQIEFVMCNDINYIFDNQLVTFVKHDSEWICDQVDVPNALNIYFAPHLEKSNEESICGYAGDFDIRPRIFVDNNCADGATLSHEFGHSFSLVHTHRTINGSEHASGNNCATAGDFLCDTPADPQLSNSIVNTNCEYTGTALDNEQNPYDPDTGNVMSYSRASCVNNFSGEQLLQMRAYFDLEGFFLNCLDTPTSIDAATHSSIRVYPNPSDNSLFIENIPKNATIQIWNSNGQLLTSYYNNTSAELIELEKFNDFNNGIYYLKIFSLDTFFTEKIIRITK